MSVLLKVDNLSKSFGGIAAVNNVSIQAEKGTIVSVIGPNGAGKTTFFNLVTGFYTPDSGSVVFDEKLINGLKPHQYSSVGMVRTFQNIHTFKELSVLENALVGLHGRIPYGTFDMLFNTKKKKEQQKLAEEKATFLLREFGFGEYIHTICKNMPYGMQKKLEIVRAVISDPKLVLLDEPAAGLNPQESAELREAIRRLLDRDITVLLIEHDMKLVMEISDYIYVMDHGMLISEGAPEQVKADQNVIEAYMGKGGIRRVDRGN